jgi:hypothetical protein
MLLGAIFPVSQFLLRNFAYHCKGGVVMRSKRCLVVVSGEGYVEVASFQGSVSAYSFIQTHSLLTRAHVDVTVASIGGKVS